MDQKKSVLTILQHIRCRNSLHLHAQAIASSGDERVSLSAARRRHSATHISSPYSTVWRFAVMFRQETGV